MGFLIVSPPAKAATAIDVTEAAVQTVWSSGVPHIGRDRQPRTSYEPTESVFLNGVFAVSDEPKDRGAIPALATAGFNAAVTARNRAANPQDFSDPDFFIDQVEGPITYRVTVSVPGGQQITKLTQQTSLSIWDAQLSPGQKYAFTVCVPNCAQGTTVRAGTARASPLKTVSINWRDGSDLLLIVDNRMIDNDGDLRYDPGSFDAGRFNSYKSNEHVFGWWMSDEPLKASRVSCGTPQYPDPCAEYLNDNFNRVSSLYGTYGPQTTQALLFNEGEYASHLSGSNFLLDSRWWPRFVDVGDVLSSYYYPKHLGSPAIKSLDAIGSQVRHLVAARGNSTQTEAKPVWFIPQAFNGAPTFIYPTPQEAKAQIYTAIVHGATGLIHFAWDSCAYRTFDVGGVRPAVRASYGDCPGGAKQLNSGQLSQAAELWDALDAKQGGVNEELEQLAPWLLSPTSDVPYRVSVDRRPNPGWSPLRTMLKYRDGTYYLVAVNVDDQEVEARLEFSKAVEELALPFEQRSLVPEGEKTIHDTFGPLDVHVYRFTLGPGRSSESRVFVSSVRDVCHLPRPANNGNVIGHDVGSSARLGSDTYFLFGDTSIDRNGDGGLTPGGDPYPIVTGTIARTTDTDARDCLNPMIYKTRTVGSPPSVEAAPLLDPVPGEACMWAGGPVVANGELYFYHQTIPEGHCTIDSNFQAQAGLAKLEGNPRDMNAGRIGQGSRPFFWQWGEPNFVWPLAVSDAGTDWIYVFGQSPSREIGLGQVNCPSSGSALPHGVYVARVEEAQIASKSAYRYWNGQTWTSSVCQAEAIFPGDGDSRPFYDKALRRYTMIAHCGRTSQLCVRTAQTAGSSVAALTGGWKGPKVIYDCPDDLGEDPDDLPLDCYAGFAHPEYGNGSKIYVTTARKTQNGTSYYLTLRELEISDMPPLDEPRSIDAGSEFSSEKLANDWLNVTRSGSSYNFGLSWTAPFWAWTGSEAGAPVVAQTTAQPSATRDAVRTWISPKRGRVRASGEVWMQFSCGDGARAEIVKIGQSQVETIWSATLSSQGSAPYDVATTVEAGDALAFVLSKQGSAQCDGAFFSPTMMFKADFDGDGWSDAREQHIGTDPLDDCPDHSGDDAWPPDLDNDKYVTITDILIMANNFVSRDPRYDLFDDRAVTITTILKLARYWGTNCLP